MMGHSSLQQGRTKLMKTILHCHRNHDGALISTTRTHKIDEDYPLLSRIQSRGLASVTGVTCVIDNKYLKKLRPKGLELLPNLRSEALNKQHYNQNLNVAFLIMQGRCPEQLQDPII